MQYPVRRVVTLNPYYNNPFLIFTLVVGYRSNYLFGYSTRSVVKGVSVTYQSSGIAIAGKKLQYYGRPSTFPGLEVLPTFLSLKIYPAPSPSN